MKKVVDINYLQSPKLEGYLARSKDDCVVLTDYAGREIYKHNALNNLANKLEIISRYPSQIIILKGTREIVNITLSYSKIPQILIDDEQTAGFPLFCDAIKAAREGDKLVLGEVLLNESFASQDLEGLIKDYPLIISTVKEFAKSCDHLQLKALRTGEGLHPDILENMSNRIFSLTLNAFKKHFNVKIRPEFDIVKDSYIFRNIVGILLWSLRWIKDGGIDQISEDKIRNDIVDMSYITYATYFDGILSLDKKLNAIYMDTLNYLRLINCQTGLP
jgi:hypothetical protein